MRSAGLMWSASRLGRRSQGVKPRAGSPACREPQDPVGNHSPPAQIGAVPGPGIWLLSTLLFRPPLPLSRPRQRSIFRGRNGVCRYLWLILRQLFHIKHSVHATHTKCRPSLPAQQSRMRQLSYVRGGVVPVWTVHALHTKGDLDGGQHPRRSVHALHTDGLRGRCARSSGSGGWPGDTSAGRA